MLIIVLEIKIKNKNFSSKLVVEADNIELDSSFFVFHQIKIFCSQRCRLLGNFISAVAAG